MRHWSMARPSSTSPKGSSFAASASWARHRIELSGFTDADARSAAGLRPFPRDHLLEAAHVRADQTARGVEVLAKVLDHYPIERIAEREAA